MSLSTQVTNLATRIATEFKTVRTEIPKVSATAATLNGTNASIDSAVYNVVNLTLTGAGGFNVPTNGVEGRLIQVAALASGADRTLTFNASIKRLTGISQAITIPNGLVLRAALRYSSLAGAWILEAAALTQ